MRRPPRRGVGLVAQILVLALSSIGLALPAPTAAADRGLVVLAQTRYEVRPTEHLVHVTVEAVATSYEPDTPEGQVYYSGITFAVQPGASKLAAFSGGRAIGARIVDSTDDFTTIEVTFNRGVFYQQSYAYVVSFDLVDPGGAGTRDLRIGESLAAFPVWAFGTADEPGGSVRVELPAGYSASVQGNQMTRSTSSGGGTVLRAEPRDPLTFFVYLTADRPGAFANRSLDLDVNGIATNLLVRTWRDDPEWGRRVMSLLRRGLPRLQDLIGLDYPGREPRRLTVEEAATSRLGEYAGIYDPTTSLIRIRYDADAYVTLHEAAHIWFNDSLFQTRWINEAWAEFYGVRAGGALGENGAVFDLTDDLLAARIPLNDWGAIGVESLDIEDFAYAATFSLARDIAQRTSIKRLKRVWQAADERELAYQPAASPAEADSGKSFEIDDWKLLLDLLEERTGASYADLWTEWVVNDGQERLLTSRAAARQRYAEVTRAADDWALPETIRVAMASWEFARARNGLHDAAAILDDRDAIEATASALELAVPDDLQLAFEGHGGLDTAAEVASQELAALELMEDGTRALRDQPQLLESIGLIGVDPATALAQARASFEDGDMTTAGDAAAAAVELREGAADAGRLRVLVGGGVVLALDGAAMGLGLARRRRRATSAA
jgi:hypothetical protein